MGSYSIMKVRRGETFVTKKIISALCKIKEENKKNSF